MKFRNKKIIMFSAFIGLGCTILGGMTDLVFAGGVTGTWEDNYSYVPLAPLPGTTMGDCVTKDGKISGCTTDINTYIPGIFNLAIGIAGVLAVLMIVIGGVEYMTTDAIQGKSDGKERINNALWGLLLVLVSWILLHTINPELTIFNLSVEKIVRDDEGSVRDDYDYEGTGVILKSENFNYSRYVTGRDGVKYLASVTKTTFTHEGGGISYKEVEVYEDNKKDKYTTTKNTDVKNVVTMVWLVEHPDGGYAYLDKDGNVIE